MISERAFARPSWLFRFENRVALHVYPVGGLSGNMTTLAVLLVVSRDLLIGCVGLEKCPSPSITPERVVRKAVLIVLDHDEPHFGFRGPMCITGRHRAMISSKDFLHQNRSIRELPVLSVVLGGTWRCVGHMHLLALRIEFHGIG